MTTTTSFGYQKPEDGDKGDPVFTALESNIDQINDHKHNGVNSDRVDSYELNRANSTTGATGWATPPPSPEDGTSLYYKDINMPTGATTGTLAQQASLRFYYNGGTYDGQEVMLKWKPLTSTTLRVFSITNSQDYNVVAS